MSKKSGKQQKVEPTYAIRDIVLAKVRGFPPWPGMIVDPDNVPPGVSKERPSSKKTVFYCVRFFPIGDHAWLVAKDISKLQTHEIEAYLNAPFKRSGELLAGYRIALDPKKWEDEREAAGLEAGEDEANAEIDELDSENDPDDGDKKLPKPKKRKRESAVSPKPKARGKPKKEPADPMRKKPAAKQRKNGAKSKAMVESEDDGENADRDHEDDEDDDAGPSKKSSPPPTKKVKREKDDEDVDPNLIHDPEAIKVREWRHKLQKTFLSNKTLPKDEDMPALDRLFTTVENYDKINIQYLSFSKIGKVMRHITALTLDKVPRDGEFRFRERAEALVEKWHQILKPNGERERGEHRVEHGPGANGAEVVTVGAAALNLNGRGTGGEPGAGVGAGVGVGVGVGMGVSGGGGAEAGDATMREA